MYILVQLPTYSRPQKLINVLSLYVQNSSDNHYLFFNINADSDDLSMTDAEVKRQIQEILSEKKNVDGRINYDENTDKISAMNSHIEGLTFDVVVGTSDDMVPEQYWDDEIAKAMNEHFPNLNGCIHFNDGSTNGELITLPIMGRRLYEELGYIYHPDYKSLYCDNELTDLLRGMDKEEYIDKVIISHQHWSIPGTINNNDVDSAVQKTLFYSGRDKLIYELRKAAGFPKERITND